MNSSDKAYSKLKWTQEEEQLLRTLKQDKKMESWKKIANEMNQLFADKNRSGKQCRERYMNYVRFGKDMPKMNGWAPIEDERLFFKFMEHGAKWVQIGRDMPGRSQNCLKNRFYGAMRKIIRKINRAAKEKKLRQKKPIKSDLLIRVLQYSPLVLKQSAGSSQEIIQFLEGLKKQMIKIAINPQQNCSSQQIEELMKGITKFCTITKSIPIKKDTSKNIDSHDENNSENIGSILQSEESIIMGCQEIIQQQKFIRPLQQKTTNSPKHKIVKNLILLSSQSEYGQNSMDLGNSLFLLKSNSLQFSNTFKLHGLLSQSFNNRI